RGAVPGETTVKVTELPTVVATLAGCVLMVGAVAVGVGLLDDPPPPPHAVNRPAMTRLAAPTIQFLYMRPAPGLSAVLRVTRRGLQMSGTRYKCSVIATATLQKPIAALEIEEILLAQEAASEPPQLSVSVDHAMTWDEDGDRILRVCLRYCANGLLIAYAAGLLEIRDALSVADSA